MQLRADQRFRALGSGQGIDARDRNGPGIGSFKAEQAFESRRFSGTVPADQAKDFAGAHLEANATERLDRAITLGQSAHLNAR